MEGMYPRTDAVLASFRMLSALVPLAVDDSSPRRGFMIKSRMGRALGVAAISTGLVLGVGGVASAYTEPAISGCVDFVHTNHWYSTTQKVVGTNKCRTGTYRFQMEIAFGTGATYYTPCFSVGPGQSAGWQWPRPGRDYRVYAC
jgi:hypothetical protein